MKSNYFNPLWLVQSCMFAVISLEEGASMNLASLLDASIDDLADLPPMEAPPTGFYNFNLKLTTNRKINEKEAVIMELEVREVLEVSNPEEAEQVKVGQKFSEAFILGNEISIGRMKIALKPIGDALGLGKISDIVAATSAGIMIAATCKRRIDKNDPEKKYASLSNITVI
jgi:hypothetical protein